VKLVRKKLNKPYTAAGGHARGSTSQKTVCTPTGLSFIAGAGPRVTRLSSPNGILINEGLPLELPLESRIVLDEDGREAAKPALPLWRT
jgi:hypothetical protein